MAAGGSVAPDGFVPIPDPRGGGPAGFRSIPDPRRQAPSLGAWALGTIRDVFNRDVGMAKGALYGVNAAPLGLTQLLGRAIQEISGWPGLADWATRAAASQSSAANRAPQGDLGYALGNLLNPLYFMAPETKLGALPNAVVQGVGAGLAQPVAPGGPYWRAKAQQAAAGAGAGGAAAGLSRALAAAARTPAAELARAGVKIPLGDMLGPLGRVGGHILRFTPARLAQHYVERTALDQAQAPLIYNFVLEPLGVRMAGHPSGRVGIRALQDQADRVYDAALGKAPLAWPKFIATQLSQVSARGWRAHSAETLAMAFGLHGEYAALPAPSEEIVRRVLRQYAADDFRKSGLSMAPRVLKNMQSTLRTQARKLRSSPLFTDREAGGFISTFADQMTAAIADGNPARAALLRAADKMWARMTIVENAVPTVATEARAPGVLTLADMLREMERADPSIRSRAFAAGNVPGQARMEKFEPFLRPPGPIMALGPALGGGTVAGVGYTLGGVPGAVTALLGSAVGPYLAGEALRPVLSNPAAAAAVIRGVMPAAAAAASDVQSP